MFCSFLIRQTHRYAQSNILIHKLENSELLSEAQGKELGTLAKFLMAFFSLSHFVSLMGL